MDFISKMLKAKAKEYKKEQRQQLINMRGEDEEVARWNIANTKRQTIKSREIKKRMAQMDKELEESNRKDREEYDLLLDKYMKKNKLKNIEKAKEYYGEYNYRIDYSKYLDDISDDEEEIPVKRTRMKTKIVDNSKAQEKRKRIKKLIDEEPKLQESTSKLIDSIIKGIEEKLPSKPKKRLMSTMKIMEPIKKRPISTMKIMEPEKKKRGRPPISQEVKEQKKLEKIEKAKEEKERKQEEKEYAEREKNRQEYSKKYNAEQYKENKIQYKKLKSYIREENETGGVDKTTMHKYNDLKRRIKEYEDKYINNVV